MKTASRRSAALGLLGRLRRRAAARPQPRARAAIPYTGVGLERVIGQDAAGLIRLFGQPDADVREGSARKLQFQRRASASSTPISTPRARPSRASPMSTRAQPDGSAIDRASCVAALTRREGAVRPAPRTPPPRCAIPRSRQPPSPSPPPRATTGSAIAAQPPHAGSNAASPLFPAAIRQLRTIRSRPIRLIGEPANTCRNPASSSASRSASSGAASSARGANARLARAAAANLFHGHTARQSSQP